MYLLLFPSQTLLLTGRARKNRIYFMRKTQNTTVCLLSLKMMCCFLFISGIGGLEILDDEIPSDLCLPMFSPDLFLVRACNMIPAFSRWLHMGWKCNWTEIRNLLADVSVEALFPMWSRTPPPTAGTELKQA